VFVNIDCFAAVLCMVDSKEMWLY